MEPDVVTPAMLGGLLAAAVLGLIVVGYVFVRDLLRQTYDDE